MFNRRYFNLSETVHISHILNHIQNRTIKTKCFIVRIHSAVHVCVIVIFLQEVSVVVLCRFLKERWQFQKVWWTCCITIFVLTFRFVEWLKKRLGPAILPRLFCSVYSRVRSHYWAARGFWPAPFPTWAGAPLLRRPGGPELPQDHHIDTELSEDTRST